MLKRQEGTAECDSPRFCLIRSRADEDQWQAAPLGEQLSLSPVSFSRVMDDLQSARRTYLNGLPAYVFTAAVLSIFTVVFLAILLGIAGMLFGFGLAMLIRALIFTSAHRDSLKIISKNSCVVVDSMEAVGDLIDTLKRRSRLIRSHTLVDNWARSLIAAVLPALSASQVEQINASRVSILASLLPTSDRALALAVLNTLEQVGDGSTLRSVAFQALKSKEDPELNACVTRCFEAIQRRVEEATERRVLLRGSALNASPDSLLRPSRATASELPQELLRADSGEAV